MNRVILVGNLASDPEARTTQSGISQSTFRIAVQRRFSNQQGVREADFISVVCWRQTADFCNRYLTKGTRVAVEGSIQNRSYDAQDGSKRYITEIIADNIEFASNRRDEGGAPRQYESAPTPPPAKPEAPSMNDFTEVDDDELPF